MMKFLKSIPGKAFLYILETLSITICCICMILSLTMYGMGFYGESVKNLKENITKSMMETKIYDYMYAKDLALHVTIKDTYELEKVEKLIEQLYQLRYKTIVISVIFMFLSLLLFIVIMTMAGKQNYTNELVPGPLFKIPIDILTVMMIIVLCVPILFIDAIHYQINYDEAVLVCIAGVMIGLIVVAICLGYCSSIAVRIKKKVLIKNTIILKVWTFGLKIIKKIIKFFVYIVKNIFRNLSMLWQAIFVLGIVSFIEFIVMIVFSYEWDMILIFWFFEKIIVCTIVLFAVLHAQKLRTAASNLAKGEISFHLDTSKMFWKFKQHGEDLNNIAIGMNAAVEQRLKSERMKTELITNVSHDIKTPLTSIINYVDLILKEKSDNENINEYSLVLQRQSNRLKRLIEDLVEASKASTGNMEIHLSPCDAGVLMSQIFGEYEEKLEKAELTMITSQPPYPVFIMADGKRMQRVFDNFMNNICKYAQKGTRVYFSLEEKEDEAFIILKNISEKPLNISAEQLMERFVRGDESRSTEGNGLGLSIAKSLVELQNGVMEIEIDGDLFKVILKFKIVK